MTYPSLASFDLVDCLRLIRSENVGNITFFNLLQRFKTPAKALEAIPNLAHQGGKHAITICTREDAEREIEETTKAGARMVKYGDADYPILLQSIYDPPPILSMKGNITPLVNKKMLAIVGARNASANGYHFAQRIARESGALGMCIVSGLARGIDTGAHKAALDTGTIAVIAGGIDHIYPPENETLFRQIEEKGAIISENPVGMAPHARSFPARNRIISGIAAGTLIVEASLKSGSLITARFANEQGRDVFAVPGSPLDPRCKGTNDLLKNGAILVETIDDISTQLRTPSLIRESETDEFINDDSTQPDAAEIEIARACIAQKISPSAVLVDELLQQCHITPPVLWAALLELELAGKLQRHPGNKVSIRFSD